MAVPAGRWLAIISDGQGNDFQIALIDVTASGGKTTAKLAGAFEDFERPKLENWTASNGKISFKLNAENAEFTFSGNNIGPYLGMEPSGHFVRLPLAGFFEVGAEAIARGRLYYDQGELARQIVVGHA